MKVVREPLLVFILLGGALFALFQQVSTNYQTDNAEIAVSKGQIQLLKSGFEKVWSYSPNAKELKSLIESYIHDEVLYREALALGLDKNDGIIRRRLSQKMRFLSEDLADLEQADNKTLQIYMDAHQEQYMKPSLFSFRQVYFNTHKRGQLAQAEAESLLIKLRKGELESANSGDSIMIKHQFDSIPETEVARLLGTQFVAALGDLPIGSWQGPVKSGFGLHLVFIDKFVASKVADFDDVKVQLNRDWSAERRTEMNRAIYEKARQRYNIVVEEYAEDENTEAATAKLSENTDPQ